MVDGAVVEPVVAVPSDFFKDKDEQHHICKSYNTRNYLLLIWAISTKGAVIRIGRVREVRHVHGSVRGG